MPARGDVYRKNRSFGLREGSNSGIIRLPKRRSEGKSKEGVHEQVVFVILCNQVICWVQIAYGNVVVDAGLQEPLEKGLLDLLEKHYFWMTSEHLKMASGDDSITTVVAGPAKHHHFVIGFTLFAQMMDGISDCLACEFHENVECETDLLRH